MGPRRPPLFAFEDGMNCGNVTVSFHVHDLTSAYSRKEVNLQLGNYLTPPSQEYSHPNHERLLLFSSHKLQLLRALSLSLEEISFSHMHVLISDPIHLELHDDLDNHIRLHG